MGGPVMKIQQNRIKLPGHLLSNDLLKILQQNSKLSVKITKIISQNHAILDIGGKKLKAEFRQGVPDSNKLQLVLQRRVNNTYYFKISGLKDHYSIEEILKFTVLNIKDIDSLKLYELKAELKNIHSIFALNIAILKLSGFTNKNNSEKIADLFNMLLSKGIKYDSLILLSQLISGKNMPALQLFNILSKIFPGFNKNLTVKETFCFNKKNIIETIDDFLNSINKNLAEKDSIEAVRNIIDLMIFQNQNDTQQGDIIFFDNNEFKECKYIINGNSIFLSLNLTCLGEIDIIIKDDNSNYIIAFCCDEKEACDFLEKNVSELHSAIKRYNKKYVHIFFHNRAQVIEKVIEIISSMDLDYLLDVKA